MAIKLFDLFLSDRWNIVSPCINYPARCGQVLSSPLWHLRKSPQETGARLGSWHPGSWCGVPYHVCSYSTGHLLSALPSGSGPGGLHSAVWIREGLETGQQWPCVWCGICCVSGLEKGGSDGEIFLPPTVFSASAGMYSLGIVGQSHLRNRFSFFACCS